MRHLGPAAIALAAVAASAATQEPDQDELKRRLEKKLEARFLKNAPWVTDFDEAKAESKKSGKPIFAYFSRSYSP